MGRKASVRRRYECLRCGAHTIVRDPDEDTAPRCTVCGSISMKFVPERGPSSEVLTERSGRPDS